MFSYQIHFQRESIISAGFNAVVSSALKTVQVILVLLLGYSKFFSRRKVKYPNDICTNKQHTKNQDERPHPHNSSNCYFNKHKYCAHCLCVSACLSVRLSAVLMSLNGVVQDSREKNAPSLLSTSDIVTVLAWQ